MIAQVARNFLDRQVVETGVIEDSTRRLRARHARLDGHLAVFAVSVRQLDLRPDAEEQSGDGEQKPRHIQTVKSVIHKLIKLTAPPPFSFKGTCRPCWNKT